MARREIETGIEIDAPAARVWAILTDFARMPDWNPFIRSIAGDLAEGAQLSVLLAAPGQAAMRVSPKLLVVKPERELRWLGRVLAPGVFDAEHHFRLEEIGAGRTRFRHGESFSGVLVGFFGKTLDAAELGFVAMNAALKQRAEQP